MTSEPPREAFVWVWLPGADEPVVAGRLDAAGDLVDFVYGRSYLARGEAIPLYDPELPLRSGRIAPLPGMSIAGCIADAGPDAWGQRVVMHRLLGRAGRDAEPADLGPLTYLLESGSDRTGALDFQASPETYLPREDGADLESLLRAADQVESGTPLPPALADALLAGSSIGGARPKAALRDGPRSLIAKFSAADDRYPVVKAEFLAMQLGRMVGLDVAATELTRVLDRDVLLVERFDRPGGGRRRAMVSALTLLELGETMGRYASYADLADVVAARFDDAIPALRELFARIVFNVLAGNTDDHARNHSAFWDGGGLTLTPAYDICPQLRSGGEATQAMAIGRDGFRYSQVAGCIVAAPVYRLTQAEAREIVEDQIETIESRWSEACELARLTEVERTYFWQRQFLNPYALEGR
ncbi:MAG TPA: HipA domain-containing protein [Solirubrobacterales bacterium]|nr:HipA domain-containing protein [Solirubrobacterales bacterium]